MIFLYIILFFRLEYYDWFTDMTLADFATNYKKDHQKTKTKTQEDDEGKKTIQLRKGLGAMVERVTPAIIRYHQWREKSNLNNSIIPSFFYIFLRKMKRRIYTQDHTKGFAMQMKNSLSVTRKYMNITPVKLSGPWKRLEFQKRVGIFWLYSNNSVSIKAELKERHTISQQHVWSQQYTENHDLGLLPHEIEFPTERITNSEWCNHLLSLNAKQSRVHEFIVQWFTEMLLSHKCGQPDPYQILLTGGAGVGKSHLVRAIVQTINFF